MTSQLWLQVSANLLSLAVAIWLDWPPALILLLFWAENIVVAVWQLPRILLARGRKKHHLAARMATLLQEMEPLLPEKAHEKLQRTLVLGPQQERKAPRISNLFAAIFFLVHYGLFAFAHGAFIFSLFFHQEMTTQAVLGFLQQQGVQLALLGMMISHGYAFFKDLASGRLSRVTPEKMMSEPYQRILILHLVVLGSGFLLQLLPWPMVSVVLLTAVKILTEIHSRKHQPRPVAQSI